MTAPTDVELVEQYRRGSDAAFNSIVVRYQEKIYWVVRRFVSDHDEADDVVQEVFISASNHLRSFRGEATLYTWLYRIAVNLSLNAIRRKRVAEFFRLDEIARPLTATEARPDEAFEADEQRRLVEEAVRRLPAKQRTVFVLRYYEELPYEEIAAIVQTTVGGLKANYFHAVRKVAEYLRNHHDAR